jgi:hypothetical protein
MSLLNFEPQLTSFTYYNFNSSSWNIFYFAGIGKLDIEY